MFWTLFSELCGFILFLIALVIVIAIIVSTYQVVKEQLKK
ncbi:hypothetical protein TM50_00637 [Streptococcus parauberis]|nr:hypothetical protein TN39_01959 [Streptococcus parauberis]QBX18273.1 hypothetical protein Javan407_0040 [Streptococcus phage Javan407]KYP18598.1 hypothetical protein AKL14_00883 [Streptococcus parauberis]KYP20002.1 hypothetical protein AKL13_00801 [Streptococcus parauberis]KYP27332.1 hypothetical protein TM50_00637 [Streptococcus parauberis]